MSFINIIKATVQAACVIVLIMLALLRNTVWENDGTLWGDTIGKSPLKVNGYNELALYSINTRDYKAAIATLTAALRLGLFHPQAYTNMGVAYEGLNQVDMAILSYQKAIAMKPKNFIPYYNLGVVFLEKKHDRNSALECFLKARDLNPFEPNVHLNLALIFDERGDAEQAVKEFKIYDELK